jgi:superfamily I DNA/RNA helicase
VADLPAELLQELAAKADTKVGREAIQNVLKKRQKTEAFMALVQRASNMTFAKKVDAERWYGEQDKDAQGTTIAKFVAAAMAATADAWQPLLAQSTVDLEKATLAAQPVLAHAFREDRLAVPRDVLAAEWQFGQKRRDDDGADARSVEAPLALRLSEDQSILVHGRVDRVDGDRARGDTAVADYKSGKSKTVSKLEGEFGAGVHLQLPLYGAAVEQLFVPVHVGPSARVDVGRLQFVRHAKEARLWLAADSETWQSAAGGDHVSTPDVLHAHLRHSLRRLDQGIVPLLPRRCPALHRDAYCDFAGICGVSAAPHHAFSDPDPQPKFVRPASARHGETPKPDEARPPERLELSQETPDAEAADQAQKQALLDALRLDSDVVVSAGAGAGKTYVLVQRYVAALASGCSPDAVLAITFTRKATAEMRSRARQELLLRRKEFAHADAFRASILGIGSAPILTIDAFAARLVQSYRDDELQVVDDLRGYRQRWVDARLITAAEAGEPDAQALLAAWPVKQVREVLEDLLAHPEGLAASTRLDRRGLLAAWEEHLGRALPDWRADLAKLRTVSSGFQAAVAETIPANQDALAQLHGAVRDACTAADSLGAIGFLWGIRQCPGKTNKFSEEGEKAKAELRTLRQRYVDADAPTKSLADRMNQFETAEALREAVAEEAATTATALRIAIAWHAELKEYLARHHLAGFDDVLARAVALVEDPQLDAKDFATRFPFLHMLVDEFQDTNGEQVRLIEAVRRVLERAGHKAHLFLVGDPKQSIYRFRGAEVDVFERELARHEDGRVHVQLPVGRRARPALTRALDRLFERIFAGRTSATTLADPLATVPWQPLAPRWKELEIERKHDDDGLPCIELLKMSDEEAEAAAKIAARAALDADEESDRESPNVDPLDQVVAARLAELWATWPVKSDGKSPIALLTHSWARAQHWGKVLQKYGIPAFVQGGHGLLGTNEVRALLNVLDALEAEDDDIAWLGILRGPLTAVSDPTLYCLRRGFGLQLKKFNSPDAWLAAEDGRRLSVLRHGFQFDAAAALAGLEQQKGSPLDADVQAAVLADEVRLKRLAEWWPKVARTYGLVALADTVRMLLEYSHLQPIQHAAGGQEGLRALANVRSFLSLVDQVSDAPGRMPATPCASCVDYARRETIPRQAVATCSQAWRSRSRSCIRPRAWSGTWSCCQTCTGRRSRHA